VLFPQHFHHIWNHIATQNAGLFKVTSDSGFIFHHAQEIIEFAVRFSNKLLKIYLNAVRFLNLPDPMPILSVSDRDYLYFKGKKSFGDLP
jgi:hypothetical protein